MKRWFGLIDDPTAAGSTLDILTAMVNTAPAIAVPDLFVPVTTAQADPGESEQDRNNEVRGVRGNTPPESFAQAPSMSFESRAYPKLLRRMIPRAFSGTPSSTGTAPASIASTVGPIGTGSLKTLIAWLVREGQLDRMTGCAVSEFELNFPIDEEGTITSTLAALYHQVDDSAAAQDPNGHAAAALPAPSYTGQTADTFQLRDAQAFYGGALTEFVNLAGFGLTFNNSLIDDFRSRFQPKKNILRVTDSDGKVHKIWFPKRHKLGAQVVTGRIDFSDVDAAQENKRIIKQAEKLVFEIAAGPLGTTPAADEMLRITLYNKVLSGGGAEPIQREGDQVSSYEFTGYIDPTTGKDIEATFVGAAAIT